MSQTTKAMKQYFEIKKKFPDSIVFFQLGDFYETFYDDAKLASKVLDITLTSRKTGEPLAGIPVKAIDSYISKMVEEGYKIVIVDQLEDAKNVPPGKIVKRGVTRVITPGTLFEPTLLNNKTNNFLLSIAFNEKKGIIGISFVDISTGEFLISEFSENPLEMFRDEFTRFKPSEIIIPDITRKEDLNKALLEIISSNPKTMVSSINETYFNYDTARSALLDHFEVRSLQGYGCESMIEGVRAAGALILYLSTLKKEFPSNISSLRTISNRNYLTIDSISQRNLEIVGNAFDGSIRGSLLSIFNDISTSIGARLLRRWLLQPLRDIEVIYHRLDTVEQFLSNIELISNIKDLLSNITDFQRLMTKIKYNTVNAKDLIALKLSLALSLEIKGILLHHQDMDSYICKKITNFDSSSLENIQLSIEHAILDEPSSTLKEGNLIKESYNKELQNLHRLKSNHKSILKEIREEEEGRVNFKFKIGFNSVHGYYIEVTKAQIREAGGDEAIPSDYIRRQTLVNAERFITPELKDFEEKKLNVDERINELEYSIFCELRDQVSAVVSQIRLFAELLAELDVLICYAFTAIRNNFVKPQFVEEKGIVITNGRHPVVELLQKESGFVPNSIDIKQGEVHIITGPNMSGKSTFIRQVAVIVLMAQAGSWVPANSCRLNVFDKIFTRVGAFDRLAFGQSTFMLEMLETAHILNNSTQNSLVILDEVGRGTSTYDGLSLAWAIAEHITRNIKCMTLFATHYHQLSELENFSKRIKNFHMTAMERNGKLMLLYKIKEGSTDHSFGISVAKMAGIPNSVILSAQKKLLKLESLSTEDNTEIISYKKGSRQLSLAEALSNTVKKEEKLKKLEDLRIEILAFLKNHINTDVNFKTPIEALQDLEDIIKDIKRLYNEIQEEL